MTARQATQSLIEAAHRRGFSLSFEDANTLRRASITLQRWSELECGDGKEHGSWAIERDDNGDGPPFMVHHHYLHGRGRDFVSRTRIPDREAGALRRIKEVCDRNGLHFYHQTDPRGCALYIDREPLPSDNYSRGLAVCS